LNSRTGELFSDGTKIRLRDQPLQLLLALLENPGELVSREDLVHRLWPAGTFVDFERGLNKVVLGLREALHDSAENPQFVETLPPKGYRFIAPVTTGELQSSPVEALKNSRRTHATLYWIAAILALAVVGIALATNLGGLRDWMTNPLRRRSQISALA